MIVANTRDLRPFHPPGAMTSSQLDATLDAETLLEDRPFTHPARSLDDLRALNQALGRLRAALHSGLLAGDGPIHRWAFVDELELSQRIIVRSGWVIQSLPRLYLVGFFGQRRADADVQQMTDVDDHMVEEMAHRHDKIVAYYTAALPNGQYGNMVLSVSDDARDLWNHGPRHAQAVRELAPPYYRSIRLHNGLLEGGLRCTQGPQLTVTKYYDYGDVGAVPARPWRAVRRWDPPLSLA